MDIFESHDHRFAVDRETNDTIRVTALDWDTGHRTEWFVIQPLTQAEMSDGIVTDAAEFGALHVLGLMGVWD